MYGKFQFNTPRAMSLAIDLFREISKREVVDINVSDEHMIMHITEPSVERFKEYRKLFVEEMGESVQCFFQHNKGV